MEVKKDAWLCPADISAATLGANARALLQALAEARQRHGGQVSLEYCRTLQRYAGTLDGWLEDALRRDFPDLDRRAQEAQARLDHAKHNHPIQTGQGPAVPAL